MVQEAPGSVIEVIHEMGLVCCGSYGPTESTMQNLVQVRVGNKMGEARANNQNITNESIKRKYII